MERFTPSSARAKAIALPIPLLDAATRAIFPFMPRSITNYPFFFSDFAFFVSDFIESYTWLEPETAACSVGRAGL